MTTMTRVTLPRRTNPSLQNDLATSGPVRLEKRRQNHFGAQLLGRIGAGHGGAKSSNHDPRDALRSDLQTDVEIFDATLAVLQMSFPNTPTGSLNGFGLRS